MKSATVSLIFSLVLAYALLVASVDAKKTIRKRGLARLNERYTDSEGVYYGGDRYYTPDPPKVKHTKTPAIADPVAAAPPATGALVDTAPIQGQKEGVATTAPVTTTPQKKVRPYDPEQEEHEGEEADENEEEEVGN